jgi:hypothetical protein
LSVKDEVKKRWPPRNLLSGLANTMIVPQGWHVAPWQFIQTIKDKAALTVAGECHD